VATKEKGKSVELSGFALTVLGQRERDAASELALAIAFYLADRDANREGWAYPGFLPADPTPGGETLAVEIEPQLWNDLMVEAERQGVTVDRLAGHAVIYLAAELDSGRATERILDEVDTNPA
jgi:hypothetical protein